MVLRSEALEHLLEVVRTATVPDRDAVSEAFIVRADFARWLIWSGQEWPRFWFPAGSERVGV